MMFSIGLVLISSTLLEHVVLPLWITTKNNLPVDMMTRGACESPSGIAQLMSIFKDLARNPHSNPMLPHFSSTNLRIKKHVPSVRSVQLIDATLLLYDWA